MSIFSYVKKTMHNALNDHQVFLFEGKHFSALAFLRGSNDKYIDEAKDLARHEGMEYDYQMECYLTPCNQNIQYQDYRKEKDQFLEELVSWKLRQPVQ